MRWRRKGKLIDNTSIGYGNLMHPDLENLTSLVNFSAIRTEGQYADNGNVSTVECSLYFCILEYDEAVLKAGAFKEAEGREASFITKLDGEFLGSSENMTLASGLGEVCNQYDTTPDPGIIDTGFNNRKCNYTFDAANGLDLQNTITPILSGNGTMRSSSRPEWSSDIMQALDDYQPGTIERKFHALANSLTINARTNSRVCNGTVYGSDIVTEAYIHINLRWLIFPTIVVCGAFLFLLATIWRTRKQHIWKSSPLALMFSGLGLGQRSQDDRGSFVPPGLRLRQIEDVAKTMTVQLDKQGNWHQVGENR
jgi:hypothetical protein